MLGKTASLAEIRGDWPVTDVTMGLCPKCATQNPMWSWDREMMGWTCFGCGVCLYPEIVSMGVNDE